MTVNPTNMVPVALAIVLAATAVLGGCAGLRTSPPFPVDKLTADVPLAVRVVPYAPSPREVPLGSHFVSDSSFAFKKYKELTKTTAAFGALGVLGKQASGKEGSEILVEDIAPVFRLSLADEVHQLLAMRLASELSARPELADQPPVGRPLLELQPWVLVTSADGLSARLTLRINARLLDHKRRVKWETRYAYLLPIRHALRGDDSWTDNNAALLVDVLRSGYGTLLMTVLRDLRGPAAWQAEMVHLQVEVPGTGQVMDYDAHLLERANDTIIFTPHTKPKVFTFGVNMVHRDEVRINGGESPSQGSPDADAGLLAPAQ